MYLEFDEFLKDKKRICVIQAENPDGDSLASALALSEVLLDKDIKTSLYCPVDIPKYLHYIKGWDLVEKEFDYNAEGYIIVDTSAEILLSKILEDRLAKNVLVSKPVLVIDHHETEDAIEFSHTAIIESLPSCTELIYKIIIDRNLKINQMSAEYLLIGILSDTLGLTSASVKTETLETVTALVKNGASIFGIEEERREYMKKSQRILEYKADLIKRVEYYLEGALAVVHVPWEDIREYSDEYNPGVLILEELRMVEGVEIAVVVKTYPDGKVTGKIRTNLPIAETVAGYFGGGGHLYASGFRTYDISYDEVVRDLVKIIPDLMTEVEV